jgi:exodeoxyribonuclease V gamma subunit
MGAACMHSRSPAPIRYVHGNRLEVLAARLAQDLVQEPLADPLAAETIVVPHAGMGRWLERELARHWGIAARLALPLPGGFAWQLMSGLAGLPKDPSPYDPQRLALRVLAVLPDVVRDRAAGFPATLARDLEEPLAAYRFAGRIAQRFDEYLVFRPEWLLAWEAGRRALPDAIDEPWQAALWRRVRDGLDAPHRAALRERALATLHTGFTIREDLLPQRLSVFGVATLPPPVLDLVAALAGRIDVAWYHLNPCVEWWPESRSDRELADKRAHWRRIGEPDRTGEYEVGHPLLAAWGVVGREFLQLLQGRTDIVVQDEDLFEEPALDSTLHWLQRGMVRMDPGLADAPPLERAGESVRILACAGAQREVEVLHDALLEALAADPALAPHDIVVMSPDLARHAPLVDAVFGGAPPARRIPYTIADRTLAQEHGLAEPFLALLALPRSRLTAPEVLDLLRADAIARRFGLAGEGIALAERWVAELGIRWGLDAGMRRAEGLGDFDDGAWLPGLDRLLLGAATGEIDGLVAGVRPWSDLEGGLLQSAGALARFIDTLARWRERLGSPRPATAWAAAGRELVVEFFDEADATADEAAAMEAMRDALKSLADDAQAAGTGAIALDHAAALPALAERLQAPSTRQRYPGTGVTVCAMVPMRNVPFRIVCLLGMDDARFPRRDREDGHDLLAGRHRDGDRSLRADDRYLFLEAILAARDKLLLTYTARNPRDGSPQPPSALVEELVEFLSRGRPPGDARSLLVETAAERAIAPANFAASQRASYASEWLPAALATTRPEVCGDETGWPEVPAPGGVVEIDELLAFVRNPARNTARRVLGLVTEHEPAIEPEEPFALDDLERWQVTTRLIDAMLEGSEDPATLRRHVKAEALLPAGNAANAEFGRVLERARALVEAWTEGPGQRDARATVPIDVGVGTWRVRGALRGLDARGAALMRASNWKAPPWLELALGATLGRAAGVSTEAAWAIERDKDDARIWRLDPAALPAEWLEDLLCAWREAGTRPLPLWRRAGWVFAQHADADLEKARREAASEWVGNYYQDGEADDDATGIVARAFASPLGEEFEARARQLLVPIVRARRKAGV